MIRNITIRLLSGQHIICKFTLMIRGEIMKKILFLIGFLFCLSTTPALADLGYIFMSEQFGYSSWSLWYTSHEGTVSPICDNSDGDEVCIYRFTDATFDDWLGSNINIWNTVRSIDDGISWVRVMHPGQSAMSTWTEQSIKNNLSDLAFYWNATDDPGDYIYFRCDYNTCGSGGSNLGTFEIPLRQYGINVGDNDYINIEDLTFRFGGATADSTPENSMAIRVGDSTGITIDGVTIEYSGYWGVGAPGPVNNLRLLSSYIHDVTGGLWASGTYTNHVPGSQASSEVIVTGTYFDNIGNVEFDEGDLNAIYLDGVSGATITDNFFGEVQYSNAGTDLGSQVNILHSEDIILARNYSYRAGNRAFSFGGSETTLQTSDVTIIYNIIDSWGYLVPVDLTTVGYVNAISVNEANWETVKGNDPNDDDHGYDFKLYGNLFINGPDLLQGGYTLKANQDPLPSEMDKDSTLRIGYMKFSSVELYNNIFYNNNSVHEWYLGWHSDTSKGNVKIENNFLYDTYDESDREAIMYSLMCGEGGNRRWRYNRIVGASDDYWSYDWVESGDCGHTGGTNDDNSASDPVLALTTAGPSNIKKLDVGSPGIDGGFNLGYDYRLLLDPNVADYTTNPVTEGPKSQFSFNLWEAGPYVSYTTDGKFR
jgi:hypothetical protein